MPLSKQEVEHIANLVRLALSEDELELYREQLSTILDHAAQLQTIDTSAIPPTATVLPLRNVMRDDTVRPSLDPADVLANAPDAVGGQFRVRAVLEGE